MRVFLFQMLRRIQDLPVARSRWDNSPAGQEPSPLYEVDGSHMGQGEGCVWQTGHSADEWVNTVAGRQEVGCDTWIDGWRT